MNPIKNKAESVRSTFGGVGGINPITNPERFINPTRQKYAFKTMRRNTHAKKTAAGIH